MRKNSTLTGADLHNIVTENFAPDIKKLAHEVGANLDNPVALRAIGVHIIASYGTRALRDVDRYARIIYGARRRPMKRSVESMRVMGRCALFERGQSKPKLSRGTSLPWSSF